MKSACIASRFSSCSVLLFAVLLVACGANDHGAQPLPEKDRADAAVLEPPLEPGLLLERSILPGESHDFELDLAAGEFFELVVEQQGVDVALRLFDPQGELILVGDLPIADLGPEALIAVAAEAGVYRVVVEAWESKRGEGRYLAQLTRRTAQENDRLRATAARVFFEAEQLASRRDFEDAVTAFEEAVDLFDSSGDLFWKAQTLDQLGAALRDAGDRRGALEARNQAATLFASQGEVRFEAISHFNAGYLNFELGEMDLAAHHYRRSLELRRLARDTKGEAFALAGLADTYNVQGEAQQALDHFTRALELLDEIKDRRYRAKVLHNLGTLYRRLGRPRLALEHFRDAEVISRELRIHQSGAASLSQIGQLYFELGDYAQALPALSSSLERQRKTDGRSQSVVLRKIGSVHLAMGDPEAALRNFEAALELLRDIYAPRSKAPLFTEIGSLHLQTGATDRALGYQREALALFERIGDPIGRTTALFGIAQAERHRGELRRARGFAAQALDLAETLRIKPLSDDLRLSFFATVQQLYELYIDLLMELHARDSGAGHAAEALMVSELARARSLLDLLGEAGAEIRTDTAPALLAREKSLQNLLNGHVEQMENEGESDEVRARATVAVRKTLKDLDSTRTAIRRQSPRYAALTQPRPLDLDGIQRLVLDSETVLLQYRLGTERSYLWFVTKDSLEVFTLPPAKELEASVRKAHDLLRRSHRREVAARTREQLCDLGEQLLGPVAGKLGRKRLAIAADGALHYLPFSALPDPGSTEDCWRAEPLIAAHEIVNLPSASSLAVLRRDEGRRSRSSGLLAVMADPVFSGTDPRLGSQARPADRGSDPQDDQVQLARLPHTRQEAQAILAMVPSDRGYLGLDFEASKQKALAGSLSDFQIVHFATHAILNSEEPALSGVVLSRFDREGEPVDGFLRAHEIYSLDLPAELVVLGACETALGREVRGEGLIGLARGFMYAGAARVMVSLWKVSDRRTSELMTSFYRSLLDQGLTPPAALRAAQLKVRRQSPQPFYWAGFALQGEWLPAHLNE